MTGAGPAGLLQGRFEDGLRFLGIALALERDGRQGAGAVSAACDALGCFLAVLEEAGRRHLPDPQGEILRLRGQCAALLEPDQGAAEVPRHAVEAALLARDQAARLLPQLMARS